MSNILLKSSPKICQAHELGPVMQGDTSVISDLMDQIAVYAGTDKEDSFLIFHDGLAMAEQISSKLLI